MAVEIKIPEAGESITEVVLNVWHGASGDWLEKDDPVCELETDKASMDVPAPESGVLTQLAEEGAELPVGTVIATIDPTAERPARAPVAAASASASPTAVASVSASTAASSSDGAHRATSVARKLAADQGVDLNAIEGTGTSGRITKSDVIAAAASPPTPTFAATPAPPTPPPAPAPPTGERTSRLEKVSRLRQRIAERLVSAQQTAAMLTTFNEVDMTAVMDLRKKYKEAFAEKHGVGLGFMSFFVKACISALQKYPRANAYFMGKEVEYHDFVDISVAVGTPKGLVVPVVRSAEMMSFAEIEQTIKYLALRARDGDLTVDEMTGGTFTISNGGVYGSLNSTPILNPPQSGILGMHKIMKRAVEDPDNPGQIALRPMMYLAMSYDHRIIDGAEAVGFLVQVKDCIEDPDRLMLGV